MIHWLTLQLMKDHERGDIVKIDWLDRLAFRQIEQVHQQESLESQHLYLYVDLPRFDFPVVFSEQVRVYKHQAPLTFRKTLFRNRLFQFCRHPIKRRPPLWGCHRTC